VGVGAERGARAPWTDEFGTFVSAPLRTRPCSDPICALSAVLLQAFLKDYVANLIGSSFPNLSRAQVVEFVVGCFDMSKDLPTFKKHLRDFLVNIKEFAGEDNAELFLEENLARTQLQEKQDMAAKLAVPGLVNPNERPDEMADL
jgi:exportin-1